MRKVLVALFTLLAIFLFYKRCTYVQEVTVVSQSGLIKEQFKNVAKLVVSEGHFSEVFTYEDSKEIFGSYLTADKRALVVANTDVTIAFDLSAISYEIDSIQKILHITQIPEAEISVYPKFEYYDIQADFFNSFEAEDYNSIRDDVTAKIKKQVEASKLRANAQDRLISELSKFYILTQSLGWTLQYKGNTVDSESDFEKLLL